jgi:hypothetical protein
VGSRYLGVGTGDNVRYYLRENDKQEIGKDNHGLGTRQGVLGKGTGRHRSLDAIFFFWGDICFDFGSICFGLLCHVNRLDGAANQFRPG